MSVMRKQEKQLASEKNVKGKRSFHSNFKQNYHFVASSHHCQSRLTEILRYAGATARAKCTLSVCVVQKTNRAYHLPMNMFTLIFN